MRHFGNAPQVWDKGGDAGPVSEADLEIDQMLQSKFQQARPDYGILSEETDDSTARLDTARQFIIDPIDGTRSFINHHENWATSLAIAQGGVITDAVVFLPAKNLFYAASRGQGATLNGEKISVNNRTALRGARFLASGSQTCRALWAQNPPPIERHFRSSLAYRLCLVAQGRFDGMLTLRRTWEWDVAAGHLICTEAGVKVTCQDGQEPRYNAPGACMNGMIAANPELHGQLMQYL